MAQVVADFEQKSDPDMVQAIPVRRRREMCGGPSGSLCFSDIGKRSPLHGRVQGVLVSEVERGSLAWRHGLRAGDVVIASNRQRVRDLEEFRSLVGSRGGPLVLNVARSGGSVFILVQ